MMIETPMNAVEISAGKNSNVLPRVEVTNCQKGSTFTRCSEEGESHQSKIDIFRRVSRVTPFDIASLAVSCVSVKNVTTTNSSSVITTNDPRDPDDGDCCRSLMELSRWINPSRSSKSDKFHRHQKMNKRKAQRFDIAFLTRPSTEEESSTGSGSGSRSDSQSPELDVVALDSSCKSEDDNKYPKVKSSHPLAVIWGSKKIKIGEERAPTTKFLNQNHGETSTYLSKHQGVESQVDQSLKDPQSHRERVEETVSAFKKVDRGLSANYSHQQRLQKLPDDSNTLTNNNQTRILLPNTSLVNGGLRPGSSDPILNAHNKNIPYTDNVTIFKARFQIPDSTLLGLPNGAVDVGMGISNFSKNDVNYSSGNSIPDNSSGPNDVPGTSGANNNYSTKSYSHPLLPFLPPSLAALTFPTQNWCAKCNASFRMTSDLVYHMRSHHKKETDVQKKKREEKLRCDICHESFRERHHLTRHMTSHQ